mgnify:FL=1
MGITFEHPLVLLLALAVIPLAWLGVRTFSSTMSPARVWSAVIARSILIGLTVAMLAGASAVQQSNRVAVLALVDVSDSMRVFGNAFAEFPPEPGGTRPNWAGAITNWLIAAGELRRTDDLIGVIAFDGDAVLALAPTSADLRDLSVEYRSREGTDIANALRYADSIFPPDARRRIVLISDGNETLSDALEAARELAAGGSRGAGGTRTPVDVVPIAYRVRNEVMVERVDTPPQAAPDSTITVRTVIRATDPAAGRLDLLYNGRPLDISQGGEGYSRRVTLEPGQNIFTIDVPLARADVHSFEPVFTPDDPSDDQISANNRAEAFTVTPGEGRIALVDADPDRANSPLARTLRAAGLPVDVLSPGELPDSVLQLQGFDLIILNDISADQMLPRARQRVLADYVQTLGGGLVKIGGRNSYAPGGWKDSPIEDILPVLLDLPDEVITPSAAIAFVIDNSGSMARTVMGGSLSQQQIANDAAAIAVGMLDRTDLISVIEFNSTHRVVVPMGPNSERERNARLIRQISPGGGTNMYPAMALALQQLERADANVKHMIVLTDGITIGHPSEGYEIARAARDRGITISTIAVGDDIDRSSLFEIATIAGGGYHHVFDPTQLPRIFIREIRVVRQPEIREGSFSPVVLPTGSPLVANLPANIPPLEGIVLTQPRDDPRISFAMATPDGEPLLAHWFVGRGQVAAFTSDAANWARNWITTGWPGYSALWTQVARSIARPSGGRAGDLLTEIDGEDLVIRYEAYAEDGRPLDMRTVPATVYTPDNRQIDVRLDQTGPGVYEARIRAPMQGTHVVAVAPRRGDRALPPVVGGTTRAMGSEFQRLSSNTDLLRRIAETTGGRILSLDDPEGANLFDRSGVEPVRAVQPLWPTLIFWCMLVFILDVGTRRIAWDRLISNTVVTELREVAASVTRSEKAAKTAETLRNIATGSRAQRKSASQPQPGEPPIAPRTDPRSDRLTDQPDETAVERRARAKAEQEQRMQAARERMLSQLQGQSPDAKGNATDSKGKDAQADRPDKDDAGGTSGLLAAKRRARQRYEDPSGGS